MELNAEQKINVVHQKLANYQAQIYSAKLDMDCAEALQDEQWKKNIRESTKRLMKLVSILEKELEEIEDKTN